MQERHVNRILYFEEESITTKKYVIPYIEDFVKIEEGTTVLEIGCGEGGNLIPFLDKGCNCIGIDLSEWKIEFGREISKSHKNSNRIEFINADIYSFTEENAPKGDVIIMRDVLEHIHDQNYFMNHLKRFLKKDSVIFLAFPPWRMPFGGHQQILPSKFLSKLPYYHILPMKIYKWILKIGKQPEENIQTLMEIKETCITLHRYERILKENNFEELKATDWFINPNYEIKFNLKPRKLLFFNLIPFFEIFSLLRITA